MGEETAAVRQATSMSILIVDDESSIREACTDVVQHCGMKVTAVATADEAVEVLEESVVDILLTDLKLQDTSGLDLLKRVASPGSWGMPSCCWPRSAAKTTADCPTEDSSGWRPSRRWRCASEKRSYPSARIGRRGITKPNKTISSREEILLLRRKQH